MGRRKARDASFKYIYAMSYGEGSEQDTLNSILSVSKDEIDTLVDEEKEFFNHITMGINNNLENIDKVIFSKLKKWTIDRIFKIDLAILRVAVYEIMYSDKVPCKVAVNEAVELAKKYGNDESYTFINGVLREVIKDKEN